MTLNQVVKRVQTLAKGHNQVRCFFEGNLNDFLDDKDRKYTAVIMQLNAGSISLSAAAASITVRLYVLDLVHIAADAKSNELDVQSDSLLIVEDLIAQMAHPLFSDWKISQDNSVQLLVEELADYLAGVYIDIEISMPYTRNTCQIPSEITDFTPIDNDMKTVYDLTYVADGTEGNTLTIPELSGKKILLVTRDNNILYKTSSGPDSTGYTWDLTDIVLGLNTAAGQRFLILYRTL